MSVKIRKIFFNANAAKNPITVQFQGEVVNPQAITNKLVAAINGITGTNNPTALLSFPADNFDALFEGRCTAAQVEAAGKEGIFMEDLDASFLEEKLGVSIQMQVTENTVGGQGFQPKINPSTGNVLTLGGKVIFRKTEVTDEANHTFLRHDGEIAMTADEITEIREASLTAA